MQEEHVNMKDVRNQLGVKSVRIKIEKRVLERIGHIFRMEDDRQVKIATLGWLEELEGHEKRPGKKRKTVLYWKRLLKEAGIDWTKISMLTRDRKAWKITVRSRAEHLQEWERKAGHRVDQVLLVAPPHYRLLFLHRLLEAITSPHKHQEAIT